MDPVSLNSNTTEGGMYHFVGEAILLSYRLAIDPYEYEVYLWERLGFEPVWSCCEHHSADLMVTEVLIYFGPEGLDITNQCFFDLEGEAPLQTRIYPRQLPRVYEHIHRGDENRRPWPIDPRVAQWPAWDGPDGLYPMDTGEEPGESYWCFDGVTVIDGGRMYDVAPIDRPRLRREHIIRSSEVSDEELVYLHEYQSPITEEWASEIGEECEPWEQPTRPAD